MRSAVPRPHWSYSSVSQYLKCPLQYYFERIARLPRKSATDAQVLGASLHSALADHHRKLQARRHSPAQEVHQAYQAAWDAEVQRGAVVAVGTRSVDDARDLGISLIDAYLGEPAPQGIIAVESPVMAPIANSQGDYLERPILMIADLITQQADNELQVVEIKTSSRAYSESEVATSLQPTFYANAVYETTGVEPSVDFAVLVKTRVPKVQKIGAIRTISDYRRLGDLIGVVEKAVEAEVFYPVESPINCSGCPFYRPCREWTGSGDLGKSVRAETEEAVAC